MQKLSFIESIKEQQRALWALIKNAEQEGLLIVDEENDAISATLRLLWTYPGLHEVLVRIINDWHEQQALAEGNLAQLLNYLNNPR